MLLLAAPGKAAYNFTSKTIHSSLAIPDNHSHLDPSRLNTIRSRIAGVKLKFLDEISVVGNCIFNINICYLPGGRSVWKKNCARGLEYGPRRQAHANSRHVMHERARAE